MAKTKAKAKKQALISPVGIAHWLHIWKPQVNEENPDQEPKFSVTLVFSKKTNIEYLEKAIRAAAIAKFKGKAKAMLKSNKLTLPIRDGDEEVDDNDKPKYKGCYFIVAKTTQRPGVVDQDREPIEDQFDLYAGCKVRLSLFPFAYNVKGNKGVTFMLNNVQKIADGERLSGRAAAEDDFDDDQDFSDERDDDEDEDDDDDRPARGKKSKTSRRSRDEDDEDEDSDDEDEDSDDDEDEDEDDDPPARKKGKAAKKSKSRRDEDDEDEDDDDLGDDEDDEDEDEDDDPPPRRRRK